MLLSLHPAVGAIVGFLVLDQAIDVQTGIAIGLVVIASIVAARSERHPGAGLMCGRFTVATDPAELAERFEVELPQDWTPSYNVAPTQDVLGVVRGRDAQRRAARAALRPRPALGEGSRRSASR